MCLEGWFIKHIIDVIINCDWIKIARVFLLEAKWNARVFIGPKWLFIHFTALRLNTFYILSFLVNTFFIIAW